MTKRKILTEEYSAVFWWLQLFVLRRVSDEVMAMSSLTCQPSRAKHELELEIGSTHVASFRTRKFSLHSSAKLIELFVEGEKRVDLIS